MEIATDRENTWLTIQEAADHLGVNPRTVRRYMRLGRLEASRISNKVVRIRLADLDRLMESNLPAKKPVVADHPAPARPAVRPAKPAGFTQTPRAGRF
jgi:excisionase family DNA binding protein